MTYDGSTNTVKPKPNAVKSCGNPARMPARRNRAAAKVTCAIGPRSMQPSVPAGVFQRPIWTSHNCGDRSRSRAMTTTLAARGLRLCFGVSPSLSRGHGAHLIAMLRTQTHIHFDSKHLYIAHKCTEQQQDDTITRRTYTRQQHDAGEDSEPGSLVAVVRERGTGRVPIRKPILEWPRLEKMQVCLRNEVHMMANESRGNAERKRGRPPGSKNNKSKVRDVMLEGALSGSAAAAAEWRRLGGARGKPQPPPLTDEERIKQARDEADDCLKACGLYYEHEGMTDSYRRWMGILGEVSLRFLLDNPHEPAAARCRIWFAARNRPCPLDD
jgi:hypothetical protein